MMAPSVTSLRRSVAALAMALTCAGCGGSAASGTVGPAGPMRIYWIDVEGGAATLVVAPGGETLLADAGWSDARDDGRILSVLDNEVGRRRIDYLIATHYHGDHVGGITKLLAQVPVTTFIDHGPSVDQGRSYDGYLAAVGTSQRRSVKPGGRLQLGEVEIVILTAAGEVTPPLASAAPNPYCAGAEVKTDVADEDPQSVGFLARFGSFDFVDLGDLTWGVEHRLACPENRVGPIELFQASQHGSNESNPPQLVHALAPVAAVINNGPVKGGLPPTFETLRRSPGLLDIWQVHHADNNDSAHNTDAALTANSTNPDGGHWIKATIQADGSFTLTNGRTGETRSYRSR